MNELNDSKYIDNQNNLAKEYEALCKRCGKCCGLEMDPCVHLKKDALGKYYCAVYESRLGRQVTISGLAFTCVSIREVVRKGLPNEGCGYGRY